MKISGIEVDAAEQSATFPAKGGEPGIVRKYRDGGGEKWIDYLYRARHIDDITVLDGLLHEDFLIEDAEPVGYFISFSHPGGLGNAGVVWPEPISSIDVTEAIAKTIEASVGCECVVITGWQRFEAERKATP